MAPGLIERFTATRWRVAWGYLGAALLLVLADPVPASLLAGSPLVAAGEAVRILANGSLIKDKRLTDFGIYAHLRHPLYVGSALIGFGFLIMARSVVLAAVFVVLYLVLYRRTIMREEEKMERLYGDAFRRWAAATPRFIPRRLDVREIADRFTFSKAWVNREHEGLAGVIALTVVLYLKFRFFG
jgi:protein-S-isoprenylcysteine O-methyltransferase Ste14